MALSRTGLARKVAMRFIDEWVKTKKTPVPKNDVFKALVLADISETTARKTMTALLRDGYIRKACTGSVHTYYVQLRNYRE